MYTSDILRVKHVALTHLNPGALPRVSDPTRKLEWKMYRWHMRALSFCSHNDSNHYALFAELRKRQFRIYVYLLPNHHIIDLNVFVYALLCYESEMRILFLMSFNVLHINHGIVLLLHMAYKKDRWLNPWNWRAGVLWLPRVRVRIATVFVFGR